MKTKICKTVNIFSFLYDAKLPIANGNIKNKNKNGLVEYSAINKYLIPAATIEAKYKNKSMDKNTE